MFSLNDNPITGIDSEELDEFQIEITSVNISYLHLIEKLASKDINLAIGLFGLNEETIASLKSMSIEEKALLSSSGMLFKPRFNEGIINHE